MKILQEDAILIKNICLSNCSVVHEGCWVNCPTRAGSLEASTVCWRESARRVQLSGNQAAVDCVRRVAAEDLVLSFEPSSVHIIALYNENNENITGISYRRNFGQQLP